MDVLREMTSIFIFVVCIKAIRVRFYDSDVSLRNYVFIGPQTSICNSNIRVQKYIFSRIRFLVCIRHFYLHYSILVRFIIVSFVGSVFHSLESKLSQSFYKNINNLNEN